MKTQQPGGGPQFVRFFGPLLDALKKLGGSGSPEEVKRQIIQDCGISTADLAKQLASGKGRVSHQIDWARFYLTKAGLLDASRRGFWALTTQGMTANLSAAEAQALFKKVHGKYGEKIRQRLLAAKKAKAALRKGKIKAMPRTVARRIMARCARGEKKLVLVMKHGKPSSVFGFEEYLKMQELPRKVKPWQGRKEAPPKPTDELPRVDAEIKAPLKRKDFYE